MKARRKPAPQKKPKRPNTFRNFPTLFRYARRYPEAIEIRRFLGEDVSA